jgi:two-component system, cell cycle response regulator DivK
LTRELKTNPATSQTVVVAVSSYAMPADRERALAAGCDGYISKPIQTRQFVRELRAVLASAKRAPASLVSG